MTLTNLVVVGVVGRGDLNHTGALGHIGVLIAHDGNLFVDQRKQNVASVEMGIAGILCVDGNGGIAQHSLGTGSSQLQHLARFLNGVEQMIEVTAVILVFHLRIGDRGHTGGAPVNHTVTAVDQSFLIQTKEYVLNRLGASLIQSETLTGPVAGGTQLLQLFNDASAVLGTPVPGTRKEPLAADIVFGDALFAHSLHDLRLGGDGSVVGAGQPQSTETAHPLVAGQNVLQGVVQGVAHVQLSRNVRRGHNDGIMGLGFVDYGREAFFLTPGGVDSLLKGRRVISLRQFLSHNKLLYRNSDDV